MRLPRLLATVLLLAPLAGCAVTDGLAVGAPAPEPTVDEWVVAPDAGRSLAALRGRTVLLAFWSTDCSACRREAPSLQQLYETYAPQGLVVIGVHVPLRDERHDAASVAGYLRKNGLTFSVAMDHEGYSALDFDYHYLPHGVLIDGAGRVAWSGSLSLFSPESRIQQTLGATSSAGQGLRRGAVACTESSVGPGCSVRP